MIPDYQTLMRPVLESAQDGEVRTGDIVDQLAARFDLSEEERQELLPSGRQTCFASRVNWAKTYLKQAGLVKPTKRAHFVITDRGKQVLADTGAEINKAYLKRFPEFREFQKRTRTVDDSNAAADIPPEDAPRN